MRAHWHRKARDMYTFQRGGLALVASAGLLALIIVLSLIVPGVPAALYILLTLVQGLLLLAGLPVVYAMQPKNERVGIGRIGVYCIAVGTGLLLILYLMALVNPNTIPGVLVVLSEVASSVGYVAVGWVTARTRAFASWIGWTLLAAGLVVVLISPGDGDILLVAALAGYGLSIVRMAPA
jgi:hypothetical protein